MCMLQYGCIYKCICIYIFLYIYVSICIFVLILLYLFHKFCYLVVQISSPSSKLSSLFFIWISGLSYHYLFRKRTLLGIFKIIALNIYINLRRTDIIMILILPVCKHGLSFHLIKVFNKILNNKYLNKILI